MLLKKFDYLISPTAPVQPFKFGEKIDDPVTLMLLDYNTVTANLDRQACHFSSISSNVNGLAYRNANYGK